MIFDGFCQGMSVHCVFKYCLMLLDNSDGWSLPQGGYPKVYFMRQIAAVCAWFCASSGSSEKASGEWQGQSRLFLAFFALYSFDWFILGLYASYSSTEKPLGQVIRIHIFWKHQRRLRMGWLVVSNVRTVSDLIRSAHYSIFVLKCFKHMYIYIYVNDVNARIYIQRLLLTKGGFVWE